MIGTDDRHLPHFHSLHLLPLRSPRRFGDVGFMTSIHVMVYDPFNPSQVALIEDQTSSDGSEHNGRAPKAELSSAHSGTVETVITWHVKYSSHYPVYLVILLICK